MQKNYHIFYKKNIYREQGYIMTFLIYNKGINLYMPSNPNYFMY